MKMEHWNWRTCATWGVKRSIGSNTISNIQSRISQITEEQLVLVAFTISLVVLAITLGAHIANLGAG